MKNIYVFKDLDTENAYEEFRSRVTASGDLRDKYTKRKCKSCKKPLISGRYYTCVDCKPELESDDGDLIYG